MRSDFKILSNELSSKKAKSRNIYIDFFFLEDCGVKEKDQKAMIFHHGYIPL